LRKRPRFARDSQHSGVYEAAGVPKFTGVKWQFHTKGQVVSSPAIAGDSLYFGSSDHWLYALYLATGAQEVEIQNRRPRSLHRLRFRQASSISVSYDGNFYAVDGASGQLKWKIPDRGASAASPQSICMARSLLRRRCLTLLIFTFPHRSFGMVESILGSGDTNIYALDAATGDLKWKFKTGDVVHASPAISGGTLFVGSWDSYFYAWMWEAEERFGASDGRGSGQSIIRSASSLPLPSRTVWCTSAAVIRSFTPVDAVTGKEQWSYSNKRILGHLLACVLHGKVYFATSDTGLLHAFETKSALPFSLLGFQALVMFSFQTRHCPAILSTSALIRADSRCRLESAEVAWIFENETPRRTARLIQNRTAYQTTKPLSSIFL